MLILFLAICLLSILLGYFYVKESIEKKNEQLRNNHSSTRIIFSHRSGCKQKRNAVNNISTPLYSYHNQATDMIWQQSIIQNMQNNGDQVNK